MNNAPLKGISMVWLSKTDLSNLNAGEGGGGNVTELKTYDNGRKPYASGQSVRHAIREAVQRNHPGVFKCTPESPCGDVEQCWLCDVFGYLNPKLGEGFTRRWSPLKVTPALGQIAGEIVTDMLIRMSDREKSDESSAKDQRIAYVQIMGNVYRIGMSLDVANLGKVTQPNYEGKGKNQEFAGWNTETDIEADGRRERAVALLDAIGGLADFAKQARNAASMGPDVFLAGLHTRYSHRTLRALELDDAGNAQVETLRVILQDLRDDGVQMFFGYTPNVIANEEALLTVVREFGLDPLNPIGALRGMIEAVQEAPLG